MATSTKKAWKLHEFVAHGGTVNCLALGHKSGRVMVTGGDDKKVNMWAVGKPNCIMSLSGHTSPVEAVRFGNAEEMVVAGSMSGALKIWDLEAAKIVRTLTGHKSNIRSLDFHPYGDFVASGSLDTNIKLWDIRRKGCIFTYKGHTNCVNCLRFSPDGRWIASAGEDGLLKLWDLTAGKLLTDFKHHSGPVTTVEFHPNEYLVASGSSDRTIKFWDLESFQLVSSTDGDSTAVRCIFFHPDGLCVYGGVQDMVKVYGWEPPKCYDSIAMGWGKVADVAMAQNQLIGATFNQTNVSTFVVDIQRVQPLGGSPVKSGEPMSPPMTARVEDDAVGCTLINGGRRSFLTVNRPSTQSTKNAQISRIEPEEASSPSEDGDDESSSADIKDPIDFQEIFQPSKQLSHSPPKKVEPFPAPPDDAPVTVHASAVPQPCHFPEKERPKPPVTKPVTAKPPTARPAPVKQVAPTPVAAPEPVPAPIPIPTPVSGSGGTALNADDFLPKKKKVPTATLR